MIFVDLGKVLDVCGGHNIHISSFSRLVLWRGSSLSRQLFVHEFALGVRLIAGLDGSIHAQKIEVHLYQ